MCDSIRDIVLQELDQFVEKLLKPLSGEYLMKNMQFVDR